MLSMPLLKEALRTTLKRFGYIALKVPSFLLENPKAALEVDLGLLVRQRLAGGGSFFFIQIGAYDGKANDPLFELVRERSLNGILIEPQPDVFETLRENYRDSENLIFENCAIGKNDGELVLYRLKEEYLYLGGNVAKQITSPYREHIEKLISWDSNTDQVIEKISVPSLSLKSLLAKHGIVRLDVLQLDTEGYDFEIIKTIDFTSVCPQIINYEHVHLSAADQQACWELLVKKGYKLQIGYVDTLAVHSS
mgnify:CR=1 FL=1